MAVDRRSSLKPSLAALRSIGMLARAGDDVLRALAEPCTWRRFEAGQRVLSKDARDRDVYLVISGSVRATSFSAGGREVTYRTIGAGEWFGDLAAIDGRPRSVDVIAEAEAVVATMHHADFVDLLRSHADVAEAMLRHLVHRVRDLTDRLFELSTLGVQNRVDAELLRLARAAGVDGNVARIDPAPSHADVASRVSTYREQVTRELSQLTRLGILERAGKALVVTDVARLTRMVEAVRRAG